MPQKTVVIACSTIRPEITKVMEELGCSYEIFFMDAQLHDHPEKLRAAVQAQLDAFRDVDRVLMPFGYCGGTTVGLKAGNFELILPKVDDCITLFLGSMEARRSVPDERHTFFLTKGWLDSQRNILREHERLCEKYNSKRADRVMQAMYQNYVNLSLVDPKLFPLEPQTEVSQKIADLLKLNHTILPGTDSLLRSLLRGDWDKCCFLRIKPFETITKNCYSFTSL